MGLFNLVQSLIDTPELLATTWLRSADTSEVRGGVEAALSVPVFTMLVVIV